MDSQIARTRWNPQETRAWFLYIKLRKGSMYQVFTRENKDTKIEHACKELNPAKQMSGPWCPHQSTNQCSEKQLKMRVKQCEYERQEAYSSHSWKALLKQRVAWLQALISFPLAARSSPAFFSSAFPFFGSSFASSSVSLVLSPLF